MYFILHTVAIYDNSQELRVKRWVSLALCDFSDSDGIKKYKYIYISILSHKEQNFMAFTLVEYTD